VVLEGIVGLGVGISSCRDAWEIFLVNSEIDEAKAGGSFLLPFAVLEVDGREFGGGCDVFLDPRGGGGRGTVTQSGSSVML